MQPDFIDDGCCPQGGAGLTLPNRPREPAQLLACLAKRFIKCWFLARCHLITAICDAHWNPSTDAHMTAFGPEFRISIQRRNTAGRTHRPYGDHPANTRRIFAANAECGTLTTFHSTALCLSFDLPVGNLILRGCDGSTMPSRRDANHSIQRGA